MCLNAEIAQNIILQGFKHCCMTNLYTLNFISKCKLIYEIFTTIPFSFVAAQHCVDTTEHLWICKIFSRHYDKFIALYRIHCCKYSWLLYMFISVGEEYRLLNELFTHDNSEMSLKYSNMLYYLTKSWVSWELLLVKHFYSKFIQMRHRK